MDAVQSIAVIIGDIGITIVVGSIVYIVCAV